MIRSGFTKERIEAIRCSLGQPKRITRSDFYTFDQTALLLRWRLFSFHTHIDPHAGQAVIEVSVVLHETEQGGEALDAAEN
jgi:hypothetical protein